MRTITEIEHIVYELAKKLNAPTYLLPTFSTPRGDATPNVEVDSSGLYYFVISEKGNEYERRVTHELNDLLYWIFSSVTFSMACDFELNNRIKDMDCRRMIFAKHEELLGRLNNEWQEKMKKEHHLILINNPFNDF